MAAPGVSRWLRCQSPTQPALCALRRQHVAAVSAFVSHWRRVCANRKERLRLPPPAVTRSHLPPPTVQSTFEEGHPCTHQPGCWFFHFILFYFSNLALSDAMQSVLHLKSSSRVFFCLFFSFWSQDCSGLHDVSPSSKTLHCSAAQEV